MTTGSHASGNKMVAFTPSPSPGRKSLNFERTQDANVVSLQQRGMQDKAKEMLILVRLWLDSKKKRAHDLFTVLSEHAPPGSGHGNGSGLSAEEMQKGLQSVGLPCDLIAAKGLHLLLRDVAKPNSNASTSLTSASASGSHSNVIGHGHGSASANGSKKDFVSLIEFDDALRASVAMTESVAKICQAFSHGQTRPKAFELRHWFREFDNRRKAAEALCHLHSHSSEASRTAARSSRPAAPRRSRGTHQGGDGRDVEEQDGRMRMLPSFASSGASEFDTKVIFFLELVNLPCDALTFASVRVVLAHWEEKNDVPATLGPSSQHASARTPTPLASSSALMMLMANTSSASSSQRRVQQQRPAVLPPVDAIAEQLNETCSIVFGHAYGLTGEAIALAKLRKECEKLGEDLRAETHRRIAAEDKLAREKRDALRLEEDLSDVSNRCAEWQALIKVLRARFRMQLRRVRQQRQAQRSNGESDAEWEWDWKHDGTGTNYDIDVQGSLLVSRKMRRELDEANYQWHWWKALKKVSDVRRHNQTTGSNANANANARKKHGKCLRVNWRLAATASLLQSEFDKLSHAIEHRSKNISNISIANENSAVTEPHKKNELRSSASDASSRRQWTAKNTLRMLEKGQLRNKAEARGANANGAMYIDGDDSVRKQLGPHLLMTKDAKMKPIASSSYSPVKHLQHLGISPAVDLDLRRDLLSAFATRKKTSKTLSSLSSEMTPSLSSSLSPSLSLIEQYHQSRESKADGKRLKEDASAVAKMSTLGEVYDLTRSLTRAQLKLAGKDRSIAALENKLRLTEQQLEQSNQRLQAKGWIT